MSVKKENLKENIENLKRVKAQIDKNNSNLIERWISNCEYGFEAFIQYNKKKWKGGYLIHYYSEDDDIVNFIIYLKDNDFDARIVKNGKNDIRKIFFGANYYYQIFIRKIKRNE